MVAKPSRMFPLDARVLRRGAGALLRDFMSGIDFFTRKECVSLGEDADKYEDGARDNVWRMPALCGC